MKRPIGVTIVAVLAIILGVLQLLGGLGLLGAVTGLVPGLTEAISGFMPGAGATGLFGALGIGAGVAAVIMAVLSVVFGVGALGLRPWAWTLGVVLFAISVISGVVALVAEFTIPVLISTVVAAAILAYLFTREVRSAFHHEHGFRTTRGTHGPVVHS